MLFFTSNLQLMSSVIAAIDMGISLVMGVLLVVDCFTTLTIIAHEDQAYSKYPYTIFCYIIFFVMLAGEYGMGVLLKTGAKTRSLLICKIWLFYNSASMLLCCLVFLALISTATKLDGTMEIVLSSIHFIYNIWALCVIYKFIKEIQAGGDGEASSNVNYNPI